MGSLDFAVSIHSLVTSGGAYAGFAAVVGLAILVLLHFAQARESAGLREQVDESAQRVAQLEARLGQLLRQPAAAAPQASAVPAPAPATAAAAASARTRAAGNSPAGNSATAAPVPAGVAAASFPWAPAGVAAPALTAATTLIPVGAPAGGPARPPQRASAQNGPVPARAPAPVGVGANGAAQSRVGPAPVGARAAGGGEPPRTSARPGGGAPRFLPPQPEASSRSRTGRVIAIVLGVLLLAAAAAVALIATSTIGGKSASAGAAANGTGRVARQLHAAAFNPRLVTVAVLNGTATAGLAGHTSKQLLAAGYKPGTVATASAQTHNATSVAYLPGYRVDAVHVAAALKLPAASVHRVDSGAQAIACPPPSRCSANVVVTVGADLASP